MQTDLPFPNARTLFGSNEFNQQYFEFYYQKLLALADAAAGMSGGAAGGGQQGGRAGETTTNAGSGQDASDKHALSEHSSTPFQYMGSRRDFTTKLLFAVDVSGSIPSADLERGFSLINQFFRYGIEQIDVIQFDTEIKGPPLTLKRARRAIAVLGRGGTNFAPVLAYLDEHRDYDGLIIFTDGYAPVPPPPQNRTTRILWLFNHEANYQAMARGLRTGGLTAFLKA